MNRRKIFDYPNHPTPFQNSCDGITFVFMKVTNEGLQLKWTDGIAGPCLNYPTHPPKNYLNENFGNFGQILIKFGGEVEV